MRKRVVIETLKDLLLVSGLLMVLGFGERPCRAQSITVFVDPANQYIPLGSSVVVDAQIFGLEDGASPSLGSFDFNLSFDPNVLSFVSMSFGDPNLGDQLSPIAGSVSGFNVDSVSGTVNQFEVSLDLPDTLDSQQLGSFGLVRFTFDSIGFGSSPLLISDPIFGDSVGGPLGVSIKNGFVTVNSTTVPDSVSSIQLFSIALVMMICITKLRKFFPVGF